MYSKLFGTLVILIITIANGLVQAHIPPHPPTMCLNRPDGMFLRDFTACDSWFRCKNGTVSAHGSCQSPFLFDEKNQMCNWDCRVDCFKCPRNLPFTEIEIPGACRQFVRCIDNEPEHLECQPGLLFDPILLTCNYEDLVNCTTSDVPPELQCPAVDDPDNRIFFRDEENCGVFYVCIDGDAHRQECAPDLHFNPTVNQCDYQNNTDCSLNIPEGPAPPIFECAAQPPGTGPVFPHPWECNSYIVCDTLNNVHVLQCAPTFVFDYIRLQCDVPERATCIPGAE